jgi:hypothetical protein
MCCPFEKKEKVQSMTNEKRSRKNSNRRQPELDKEKFFKELKESYARLKEEMASNPELAKEIEEEQRLWDSTLMDGLEEE